MPEKMEKATVTKKDAETRKTVPEGYKMTEVGVIPEDWACKKLGDLTLRVGSGITPTGGERVYKEEGRPFVRSQNVGWGKLELDDLVYITDEVHSTFPASEIKQGDVLLNITGASIGRSAVADDRIAGGNVNQHVCEIRTVKTKLDPFFLNAFLISKSGQQQIDSFQAGGNRQGLNYQQIRSFVIPLPPLPEQRAIARALSDVDKLLEALDKLIAKKKAIKQAAMQQLLTGKVRLPGFSGEWEEKRLGEVANIEKGDLITADTAKEGEIPVIGGGISVTYFHDTPNRIGKNITISASGANAGYVAFYDKPIFASDCSTIGESTIYSIKFLYYSLKHQQKKITSLQTGGAQPHIYPKHLRNLKILFPSRLDEQNAIASVLSDIDAEIQALERRREKIKKIKQGMMQQLLTGRIRLVSFSRLDEGINTGS